MRRMIVFFSGYFLGIISLVGCAAVTYRYYGVQIPTDCYKEGKLIGKPGSWPDLPFTQCQPDDVVKGKCWVELTEDHFAKDKELIQCRQSLSDCQHGEPPKP